MTVNAATPIRKAGINRFSLTAAHRYFLSDSFVHLRISFRSFPVMRSTTMTMAAISRIIVSAMSYRKLLM